MTARLSRSRAFSRHARLKIRATDTRAEAQTRAPFESARHFACITHSQQRTDAGGDDPHLIRYHLYTGHIVRANQTATQSRSVLSNSRDHFVLHVAHEYVQLGSAAMIAARPSSRCGVIARWKANIRERDANIGHGRRASALVLGLDVDIQKWCKYGGRRAHVSTPGCAGINVRSVESVESVGACEWHPIDRV
eukprot:IDg18467t1